MIFFLLASMSERKNRICSSLGYVHTLDQSLGPWYGILWPVWVKCICLQKQDCITGLNSSQNSHGMGAGWTEVEIQFPQKKTWTDMRAFIDSLNVWLFLCFAAKRVSLIRWCCLSPCSKGKSNCHRWSGLNLASLPGILKWLHARQGNLNSKRLWLGWQVVEPHHLDYSCRKTSGEFLLKPSKGGSLHRRCQRQPTESEAVYIKDRRPDLQRGLPSSEETSFLPHLSSVSGTYWWGGKFKCTYEEPLNVFTNFWI